MFTLVITDGSYPYGEAATNRHLSYLRGLAELSDRVDLIILSPAKNQDKKSNKRKLNYKSISILYLSPLLFTRNRVLRIFNFLIGSFLGLLFLGFYLLKYFKNLRNVKLLLLITNPFVLLFYITIAKAFGIKVFHERTEYPFISSNEAKALPFYLRYIIPRFDGLIVITHALKSYFEDYFRHEILVLPMTVECDRFEGLNKKLAGERYIAYCGSMYTDKDGVPDLINAFNFVANEIENVKLKLVGDNSDQTKFKTIQVCIEKSLYKERIECTGLLNREEMPQILFDAEILALARPDNIQARGGFPTKLGEYLATGNPVVITDVGEHSLYLTDMQSACIVKPGNPEQFAGKIILLLKDSNLAGKIGFEGKKVALSHFDYRNQSENLLNFFTRL